MINFDLNFNLVDAPPQAEQIQEKQENVSDNDGNENSPGTSYCRYYSSIENY